jgi:ketosteroid isomerase-like protein
MTHPNESLLREGYAAFARGDVQGFFSLCTPDFRMYVPGNGLLSGTHTKDSFLAALGPAMGAVAGSFREEVVRIVANDTDACVYAAQRAERDGKTHTWNAVHLYRIAAGKLAEFRELTDDQAAFDAAWHR